MVEEIPEEQDIRNFLYLVLLVFLLPYLKKLIVIKH